MAARVRPGKVNVLGRLMIEDFASRPAAEWGADYARFLRAAGIARLSATVLLPRREVIVRHLALPGVAAKDIEGAIRFQIDTPPPVWRRRRGLGLVAARLGCVLVGIALRATVERYNTLFVEAGIAVGASPSRPRRCMPPSGWARASRRREGFVALEPHGDRRGGSLRRKPGAAGVQRGVRVRAAARRLRSRSANFACRAETDR